MEDISNSKPFKIIVADDDLEDFHLIQGVIEKVKLNIQLSHVENGQYLMDILKAQSINSKFGDLPNFILLDLNMPRKSGLEVLQEMKAHTLLRNIPIIIFTTSTTPRDIENAYQYGASCYVSKPNTAQEWESTLGNLIRFWILHVIFPRSAK